jgi:hypothetical protein
MSLASSTTRCRRASKRVSAPENENARIDARGIADHARVVRARLSKAKAVPNVIQGKAAD